MAVCPNFLSELAACMGHKLWGLVAGAAGFPCVGGGRELPCAATAGFSSL